MAELQTFLQEVGMRHVIYNEDFLGPEAMTFTAGVSDHVLQAALAAYWGPWFPSFQVWWETVEPAQLVWDLGEAELPLTRTGVGRWRRINSRAAGRERQGRESLPEANGAGPPQSRGGSQGN